MDNARMGHRRSRCVVGFALCASLALVALRQRVGPADASAAVASFVERTAKNPLAPSSTEGTSSAAHIVFVLVDDMGSNDIGYQSHDLSGLTPAIDALAADGIRLSNYYSMHMCTPARAALLSGHYPLRIGMQLENVKADSPWGLPQHLTTMAEALKTMGYKTHAVGKWGLGHSEHGFLPTSRGFDTFFGYLSDEIDYFSHEYPTPFQWAPDGSDDDGDGWRQYTDYVLLDKDAPYTFEFMGASNGTHSSTLYTQRLRDLIRSHDKSAPLFLYYASQMVHGPLDAPPRSQFSAAEWDQIRVSAPSPVRALFASLLLSLDQSVGLFVEELKATQIWDRTIFVLASDNGGCWAQGGTNYPKRGGKHFLWEGGVHVPAFVYSELIPQASRDVDFEGLFHVTDWYPTLVGVAGETPGYGTTVVDEALKGDGLYQWDSLLANGDFVRNEVVINVQSYAIVCTGENGTALRDADSLGTLTDCATPWHIQVSRGNATRAALRVGDWKLLLNEYAEPWFGLPTVETGIGYSLNLTEGLTDLGDDEGPMDNCGTTVGTQAHTWLFNLKDDPSETTDLSVQDPDQLVKMMTRLTELMKEEAPSIWQAEQSEAYGSWNKNNHCISPWLQETQPDSLAQSQR